MANSWKSNTYEGRYLQLTVTETVNPSANSSTLNWTLTSTGGSTSYYAVGETTITINGTQVYHNNAMGWTTKTFPVAKGSTSGSITIAHDSNGTKSVYISFKTRVYESSPLEYAGENITLTPIYTISYNANGGSSTPASQRKAKGAALTLQGAISHSSGTSNGYTVTFNPNGGSCSTVSAVAKNTVSYSFVGWNTNSAGTGTNYAAKASYTADANATLYAKWSGNISRGSVTLPVPEKSGYEFKGWSTNKDDTSGATGSYTPSSNITLYAIWDSKGLVHIFENSKWENYRVFINDGTDWEPYIPYIYDGTDWVSCG